MNTINFMESRHLPIENKTEISWHAIKTIKKTLNTRQPGIIKDANSSLRHAGVLIPVLEDDSLLHVLFTKRTQQVSDHKGQVSFPGGSIDDDDVSMEATALRETHEEIGLKNEDIEILGRIDDAHTKASNFVIHPYVGFIQYPYEFILSKAEVERIITIPLSIFHPDNTSYHLNSFEYQGIMHDGPAYKFFNDIVWGATARIMKNFMEIMGNKLILPGKAK